MWRDRPKDAYAALQYLQAQPFVKADHVGLIGWSQGGGVGVAHHQRQEHRPARGAGAGFPRRGVVLSGACSEKYQSKPFTQVEPDGWTSKMPLLLLMGEADTWTPFPPCAGVLAAAKRAATRSR